MDTDLVPLPFSCAAAPPAMSAAAAIAAEAERIVRDAATMTAPGGTHSGSQRAAQRVPPRAARAQCAIDRRSARQPLTRQHEGISSPDPAS